MGTSVLVGSVVNVGRSVAVFVGNRVLVGISVGVLDGTNVLVGTGVKLAGTNVSLGRWVRLPANPGGWIMNTAISSTAVLAFSKVILTYLALTGSNFASTVSEPETIPLKPASSEL